MRKIVFVASTLAFAITVILTGEAVAQVTLPPPPSGDADPFDIARAGADYLLNGMMGLSIAVAIGSLIWAFGKTMVGRDVDWSKIMRTVSAMVALGGVSFLSTLALGG